MYPKNSSRDFDDTSLAKRSRRKKQPAPMIRMKYGSKEELALREAVEKFRAYLDALLAAYDKRYPSKRRKNRKRP